MMQPVHMISNLMQSNPLGLVTHTVEKLGNYGKGITRTFGDIAGKVIDKGESGTQRVLDVTSTGAKALFDISRTIFAPNSKSQQSGGLDDSRYTVPPGYDSNSNQQQQLSANMAYNNMQPPAAGQFVGGANNNGQPAMPQGTVLQYNEYPRQQRPGTMNYAAEGNPINPPQRLVTYAQA